jgi:glycosyltransferase involved in cell wall biosynthesis
MTILSILIPTIPDRVEQFTKLFNEVHRQVAYMATVHPTLGEIEIFVDSRDKFLAGGPSIGKKREQLVKNATGKYLCFLDDDESIAPNYVEVLVRLCQEDKDVCTFRNISKFDNYWMVVDMSLHFPNEQAIAEKTCLRKPWHICPVKSEYAKLYDFPDTSYGEDWAWFEKVLTHCETEAKTNHVIHQYNFSSKTSEADKITQYEKLQSK